MKKPVSTVRGFVVDHKTSKARYAVSPGNFNDKVHTKVRELKPGETVLGFRPRRAENLQATPAPSQAPSPEGPKNTK